MHRIGMSVSSIGPEDRTTIRGSFPETGSRDRARFRFRADTVGVRPSGRRPKPVKRVTSAGGMNRAMTRERPAGSRLLVVRIFSLGLAAWAATAAQAATWDVSIQSFSFVPAQLPIKVGDTVRWTQKDAVTHTTTSGPNGVADGLWDSGNMTLAANSTFSFEFTEAGTYPYFCRPHKSFMRGAITVEAAAQGPTVSLTEPADGAVFTEPGTITLSAMATPGSSDIAQVRFFSGDDPVGDVEVPPYSVTLSNLVAGPYTLTATATDIGGLSATSAPVSVTVEAPMPATLGGVDGVGTLGVRIAWEGGTPPYLLQRTSALIDGAWADVASTEEPAVIVPRVGDTAFYRLVGGSGRSATPFSVWMNGGTERPTPVETPATGFGMLVVSGDMLAVDVSFGGLSGPATGAHIHGVATTAGGAGVLVPLVVPNTSEGTITGSYDLSGLTEDQRAALLRGQTYLNIHTAAHTAGEIRGQVAPVLWEAALNGAAERPTPVETPATGHGDFWLVGNELTYDVGYADLSAAATAAHLHGPADVETSADVLQPLAAEGVPGTAGAFSGTLVLTPEQLAAVVDGLTYINIHTPNHPTGEVRGQVTP